MAKRKQAKAKRKVRSAKPKDTEITLPEQYTISVEWHLTTLHSVNAPPNSRPEKIIAMYRRYAGKYFHVQDWNWDQQRDFKLRSYDHYAPHVTNVWRNGTRIWRGPPQDVDSGGDITSSVPKKEN